MTATSLRRGIMLQGETPNWRPLLSLVGDEVVGDFMWMFGVELSDGSRLQAYKHIDTRRYIHLSSECGAFAHEPPDRYRSYPAAEILGEVFPNLPGARGRFRRADRGIVAGRPPPSGLGVETRRSDQVKLVD